MESESKDKRKKRLIILFLVLMLISITLNYSHITFLKNWHWEHEALHAALEIFGALSAILMALVLLQREQHGSRGRFVFIVLGFISMGILDTFHAISQPGNMFVFFRSMAGLSGGLFSSLIWLPGSVYDRYIPQKKKCIWLTVTLSLLLGIFASIFPEHLPNMLNRGMFTTTAILVNLSAFVFFLSAGLYFIRDFYRSCSMESYLFACLSVFFGLASLSFFPSMLWNGEWWAWHLLRLGAYTLSLWLVVHWYVTMAFEQKRVTEALQKRTYDLDDRVKKLDCLYAISRLMDRQDASLEGIFQSIVMIIPSAWQYPEIACSRVILEDRIFTSDDFQETVWKQDSDIMAYGDKIGTLEVFYREERPQSDEGPFLTEEQHLIKIIAGRLGEFTEQKRAEEKIKNLARFPSENPFPVLRVARDGRVLYANGVSLPLLAEWNSGIGELMPDTCYRMIMEAMDSNRNIIEEFTFSDKKVFSFVIAPVSGTDYANLYGRDITGCKRSEEELRKYRSHLEELVRERTSELQSANERLQQETTERRRVEEELQKAQKLESLSVLAGGIAHDFNNLLAGIIGNLSLVEKYAKSGTSIFHALGNAQKACYRTKGLTHQLLTFSRGGTPIKKIASIAELMQEAVNFSLRGSNIRCDFALADALWPVEIDEGQISQVINNLIINACQAMPRGGTIRLGAENITLGTQDILPLKEGKYVKVSIKDQGMGIPKEYLSRIFDPYFTTKKTGSGLGLAISYSIVKKHEGYITAESESGDGTTFYLYLPACEKEIFGVEDIVEEKSLTGGSGKILFMDDQESLRDMVGEMLVYLGYEVVLAREGDEAVELYRKERESGRNFDVVILDLTVPGGTGGREAVQKMLEIDPEVKAIVSSGYSYDPIMSEYKTYGFSGMVVKPYEVEELSRVLNEVMAGGRGSLAPIRA
ncbi:MAG: ATP-binding protein [bacterium]